MVESGQMVFWILSGLGVLILCIGLATMKVSHRQDDRNGGQRVQPNVPPPTVSKPPPSPPPPPPRGRNR